MIKACESGCGGTVKVFGCKWCPECYPDFSMGQSLKLKNFVVVAGKYDNDPDEGLVENCKFSSEPMLLEDAVKVLKEYSGYPWARIECLQEIS